MTTCGEEATAKEEVVKLLASWEQRGKLHYHPGTCWMNCKAQCKVVLAVRKHTVHALGSVGKAEPCFPQVQLWPACVCKLQPPCLGRFGCCVNHRSFKTGKNFANITSAPLIGQNVGCLLWLLCKQGHSVTSWSMMSGLL